MIYFVCILPVSKPTMEYWLASVGFILYDFNAFAASSFVSTCVSHRVELANLIL